jgi:anti-anti-sigma factor
MSARELTVQRLGTDEAAVLLVGDHDAYSAEQVGRTVRALLDEGLDVKIDLREATFIDSATVSALIEAHRWAEQSERGFSVVIGESTGWAVRRLFELTQLESLLSVSRVH